MAKQLHKTDGMSIDKHKFSLSPPWMICISCWAARNAASMCLVACHCQQHPKYTTWAKQQHHCIHLLGIVNHIQNAPTGSRCECTELMPGDDDCRYGSRAFLPWWYLIVAYPLFVISVYCPGPNASLVVCINTTHPNPANLCAKANWVWQAVPLTANMLPAAMVPFPWVRLNACAISRFEWCN